MNKLEREVRSRPCPGCGRMFDPPRTGDSEVDLERLSLVEQKELAGLIRAVATPPCGRCGRSGYDLTGQSDEHLRHALRLLRKLLGREFSTLAALGDADDE